MAEITKENFEESKLRRMGAAWFVSYTYFKMLNPSHKNWEKPSDAGMTMRFSAYEDDAPYHKVWLERILDMNDSGLNMNSLDLTAEQIKIMAKAILAKMAAEEALGYKS